MITVDKLKQVGFRDVSPDKNGLAIRLEMPNQLTEICWYRNEPYLRFQTIRSGITVPLMGVNSWDELSHFYHSITGKFLNEEKSRSGSEGK